MASDEHPMLSIAILAGGRASRLGTDKADARLCGVPLVQHVTSRLASLDSDDLLLVLQPGQTPPPGSIGRVVRDAAPGQGVLAGMAAALEAARHSWVLMVGCDMPWVSAPLVRYEYSRRQGYDAVVPRLAVGLEPLHAIYHRRCLATVQSALDRGERRVSRVIKALNVHYVEQNVLAEINPSGRAFVNINTLEELQQAAAWLSEDCLSAPAE
jgi:molybdopterin-guanine dinucleotide biosynthesis protein A